MNLSIKIYVIYLLNIFPIFTFVLEASKNYLMCKNYTTQGWASGMNSLDHDDKISERIHGGTPAKPKQYPHMTEIGFVNGPHPSSILWLCGGSLISTNFVLSARSCIEFTNPMWVRFEDPNKYNYKIIELITHPRYEGGTKRNDILLLKFEGLREFTDYIRPICLNVIEHIPARILTAMGHGLTEHGNSRSDQLLSVGLELQPNVKCSSKHKHFNETFSICAGSLSGGKDTCKGDSGGPLQYTQNATECSKMPIYLLVGITSYGPKLCGSPGVPGVYTRVSTYISWIEQHVWK